MRKLLLALIVFCNGIILNAQSTDPAGCVFEGSLYSDSSEVVIGLPFVLWIRDNGTGCQLAVQYATQTGNPFPVKPSTIIRLLDDYNDIIDQAGAGVVEFTQNSVEFAVNRDWVEAVYEGSSGGAIIVIRDGRTRFLTDESYAIIRARFIVCPPTGPPSYLINAENGLYVANDTTVRMGGFLIENTSITTEGYNWQMKDTLSSVEFGLDYLTPETLDTTVYWARRHGTLRQMVQLGRRYYYNSIRDTVGGLYSDFTHSWNAGDPFLQYQVFNPLAPNSGTAWLKVQKDNAFLAMSNETTNPYYTLGWTVSNNSATIGASESGSGDPGNGVVMGAYGFGTTEYLFMKTKAVDAGTATNGQFLQLIDNSSGEVDFATIDLSGYLEIGDTAAMLDPYIQGSGTVNSLVKFTAGRVIGNAAITENGSRVVMGLPQQFKSYTTVGMPTLSDLDIVENSTTGFLTRYKTGVAENVITSTGATSGQVSVFSSAGKTYGTNNLFWDNTNFRLGIGTATPSQDVHLRKGVAGAVQFSVENTTSGSSAYAGYRLINNTTAVAAVFKLSAGYTTYKNQAANDFGFINTTNGNMTFLNDVTGGNISFLTGSAGSAQMTLESDGDLYLTGKLGVGLTPVQKVDIRQDQNASTRVNISNQNTGTSAWAGISVGNSTGGGSLYKLSSGYTTYKTQAANDLGFINTVSGNISILNDWASGKIILTSGASTTQHLSVEANGRVVIGNVTPQRLLHVEGEARISDLTTDTPTRIVGADADGDLGALALANMSISGGVLTSMWLKPELNAANVDINANAHSLQLDSLSGLYLTSQSTADLGGAAIDQKKWLNTARTKYFSRTLHYDSRALISGGMPAFYNLLTTNKGSGEEYEWVNEMIWDTTNNVFVHGYGGRYNVGYLKFGSLRSNIAGVYLSVPRFHFFGSNSPENATSDTYHTMWGQSSSVSDMMMGLKDGGKFLIGADSTFIFDPNTDLLTITGTAKITGSTGTPTAVMGRDGSGNISNIGLSGLSVIAGVLTATGSSDGNGIYSNSGTLANHTTRARIPDDGNLLFSQLFNSSADSMYLFFRNNGGGERSFGFGLTDTLSGGYSKAKFSSDGSGVMNWEFSTSDGVFGNTTVKAFEGDLDFSVNTGNIGLTTPVDSEIRMTGLIRAKQEAYYEINSTSSPQTFSNTYSDNYVNQGSTQASFTFLFPASPEDGQILMITWGNAISAVTLDGNGNTITGTAVTTAVSGTRRMFKFYASSNKWEKIF